MKQQTAAIQFPAAALTIILCWVVGMWVDVPNEVAVAVTASLAWFAVRFGLSRDVPPVDATTSMQKPRKR